jgi:hypothetical protein
MVEQLFGRAGQAVDSDQDDRFKWLIRQRAGPTDGRGSGPVHVATVSDVNDRHHHGAIVNPVDDPVRAATCAQPVI